MHRIILFFAALAVGLPVLATQAFASPGAGSGYTFRGQLIVSSHPVQQQTGDCTCELNWFTFALNPGPARIDAVLNKTTDGVAKSYAIRLRLFRGNRYLTWAQAACLATWHTCGRHAIMRVHVHSFGVYYVAVTGPGAHFIQYALTVHGNIRALRCRARCR